MRSGEVKRRNCAAGELAFGGLLRDRRVLGQRFRAHVGGEELRMALFKPEVGGALVAEELVAVADEELVDADHGGFGGRIGSRSTSGPGTADAKPCASRKGAIHSKPHSSGRTTRFSSRVVSRVSHAYIQRAYQSCQHVDRFKFISARGCVRRGDDASTGEVAASGLRAARLSAKYSAATTSQG